MNRKQRDKFIIFLQIVFFLLTAPHALYAQSVLVINADRQFGFAEKLYAGGDYDHAVFELKRFIHFFPEDARSGNALFLIGNSYFNIGKYSESVQYFESFIEKYPNHELSVSGYRMISDAYVKNNMPRQAVIALSRFLTIADDPAVRDNILYRIGWIFLENNNISSAGEYFDRMSDDKKKAYETGSLLAEIENTPRKNPTLAGILSVIPGAGQLYCGRYQDALVAFLLNLGFAASAAEAFDKDLPALGSLISVVGFGFYAGNIYGAAGSAHKYNRNKTQQVFERFKKPFLSWNNDARSVALSFTFPF